MTPEIQLLLFNASRSQLVREKIQPARLGNRKKIPDRMKAESDEFHERVIRGYRELSQNAPERVLLIDGRISVDAVERQIWNSLSQCIPDVGKHQTSKINLQTS